MSIPEYRILVLGGTSAGKTTYLASMYHSLSTQGDNGFFLKTPSNDQSARLVATYSEMADKRRPFPKGNPLADQAEWYFDCCVQYSGRTYTGCRFVYTDYAGARVDRVTAERDVFDAAINRADVLIGMLDGNKILSYLNNEDGSESYVLHDLAQICALLQSNTKNNRPLHFVLTKSDLFKGRYEFETVFNTLKQDCRPFRNLVTQYRASSCPVRCIPVSSVGEGFARREPNGEITKSGPRRIPRPEGVDAPLACVLPDILQVRLQELAKQRNQTAASLPQGRPTLPWWAQIANGVGGFLGGIPVRDLPAELRVPAALFKSLGGVLERVATTEQAHVAARVRELEQQRERALSSVVSEEKALAAITASFALIQHHLDRQYPENVLR
ncbi:MAG: hypothetical protein K1Y02_26750 [Candidatus Hydrogenedentes bacterium]|nr:hypothetical protein [Candidatus Hydrogenedentota bacterium]